MSVLATIFPVFFMIGLGMCARMRGWVTPEQKSGVSATVFGLLFPILIFSLMSTVSISADHVLIVGYLTAAYCVALVVGKVLSGFTGERFAHFSNFLLAVQEGGSVALPLYVSIVGPSSNTVILDMASMIVVFIVYPVLVQRAVSEGADARAIVRNILTNSFVIAVIAGLFFNFTGLYALLSTTPVFELYSGAVEMATAPIVGMILITIGYDLRVDREMVRPLLRLTLVKVVFYALVMASMLVLFRGLMADKDFLMATLIYLSCPSGFAVPAFISPLFRTDDDASFASAFTSLYIVVTLVVYVCVVAFVA